jgi:hypothetical protein
MSVAVPAGAPTTAHARTVRAGLRVALGVEPLSRRAAFVVVPVLAALVVGLVENRASGAGAIDRTVRALGGWIVPLTTLALVGRSLGGSALGAFLWPLARFGHDRRLLLVGTFGAIAARAVAAAIASTSVGILAASLGGHRAPSTLGIALELAISCSIAALAALAYSAWFLAASFGPRGEGRFALFFADVALGDVGVVSLVLPRGAVLHLLGGAPVLELPQRASSALLVAMTLASLLLSGYRVRR